MRLDTVFAKTGLAALLLSCSIAASAERVPVVESYPVGQVEELPLTSVPPADKAPIGARGNLSYSQTEMLYQLELMQQEVQNLRGQVEEYLRTVKLLREENRTRYLDLDRRLTEMSKAMSDAGARPATPQIDAAALLANPELLDDPRVLNALDKLAQPAVAGATATSPSAPAPDVSAAAGAAVDSGVARLSPPPVAPSTPEPAPAVTPPVVAPVPTPAGVPGVKAVSLEGVQPAALPDGEKAAYDVTRELIRTRKFPEAAVTLQAFIRKFPNGEYTGHAWYWLGEVFMVLPDPVAGRDAFQHLLQHFPGHMKRPDATYKLAVVHDQLGQADKARELLGQVAKEYPGTSAASLAENYLRFMAGGAQGN